MNKKIIALASFITGGVIGGTVVRLLSSKEIRAMLEKGAKVHELYIAFDRWLQILQKGRRLVEYFERQNYKRVAIYGMKELGERLYDELRDSDITVCYLIDQNASILCADTMIVSPNDILEPVDVIVVTAIYYFDEIEEMLSEKVDCPIISLKEILYEI